MNLSTHTSAKASHYNKEAEYYDLFNQASSTEINQTLEKILAKHKVKTILDLSCGTGSQVFWLAKRGYSISGVDINTKMLKIAKEKNHQQQTDLKFIKGDMRTSQIGQFDAVITIFNSIGHLTREDFHKTIKNVSRNLNQKGLYLFDIFNLSYLLANNNITKLTIDWQKKYNNVTTREIQYSTIDDAGILASYDIYHTQVASAKPKISKAFQTLQTYTSQQLECMLQANGFKVLRQCSVDGSRFYPTKTARILTIAQKLK